MKNLAFLLKNVNLRCWYLYCCSDDGTNQSEQTPATALPPDSTPSDVNPVPHTDTDVKRPPDYNDALQYRRSEEEGYPEPSLVDQPPSYDAIY